MRPYLLIDFGSTYTKVTAVDAAEPRLLGQAKAETTVKTDINQGLLRALSRLEEQLGGLPRFVARLACSSAAGGLRLAAVGLVPELTAKAAREAALGAGARVTATFSYQMAADDVKSLEKLAPDMILLAGGTDGGNRDVVLHNAQMLASSDIAAPVVFAGNQEVANEVVEKLEAAGKQVRVAGNVMPRLNVLSVEPARAAIRQVFLDHIIRAKGLDRVQKNIDGIVMPTPAAVLKAAHLLADGPGSAGGIGPLAVIDIGGATTDVHTISPSGALRPEVIFKGLQEPYAKRTVEGDLGMRISAGALLEVVGEHRLRHLWIEAVRTLTGQEELGDELLAALPDAVEKLTVDTGYVPQNLYELGLDLALGRAAAGEAMQRHAGRMEEIHTPSGRRFLQYGKDLRPVRWVIGTGGVFVHSPRPEFKLADTGYSPDAPWILRPEAASWLLDADYILAAMGLLSEREPGAAFALLRRHLRPIGPGRPGDGSDNNTANGSENT